jgi:hypothetical protein
MINKLNDYHNHHVQLICEICSMPPSNIKWIKNDKYISNNQYFITTTKKVSIENEECVITILTIHVSSIKREFL